MMQNNPIDHSHYAKNYVDHHLQAAIIEQLAEAPAPLRFSQLKEDGVENSLFMYHLNKLVRRGIVEKIAEKGFQLSPFGARWLNLRGGSILVPKVLPRPLVQLLLTNLQGELLLARRQGVAEEVLNQWMLPGGRHRYGSTAEETAEQFLRELTSLALTPRFLSFAELIVHQEDFTSHTLNHLFAAELPAATTLTSSTHFTYKWHPLEGITVDNPQFTNEKTVLFIVEKFRNRALLPREVKVF